jgi:cytochrome c553
LKRVLLVLVLAGLLSAVWYVRRGFDTRTEPWFPEKWAARTVRAWSVPARYAGLVNPVACTPGELAIARAHWADHCAVCHANDGGGKTMFGGGMYPKSGTVAIFPVWGQLATRNGGR